jgi:hypothetical protein
MPFALSQSTFLGLVALLAVVFSLRVMFRISRIFSGLDVLRTVKTRKAFEAPSKKQ